MEDRKNRGLANHFLCYWTMWVSRMLPLVFGCEKTLGLHLAIFDWDLTLNVCRLYLWQPCFLFKCCWLLDFQDLAMIAYTNENFLMTWQKLANVKYVIVLEGMCIFDILRVVNRTPCLRVQFWNKAINIFYSRIIYTHLSLYQLVRPTVTHQ